MLLPDSVKAEQAAAGRIHPHPRLVDLLTQKSQSPHTQGRHLSRSLDSPDLPEHVYFHSLISTVVHVANLHFVGLLIGGYHLSSPPGTIHAGGSTDDRYCRARRERVDKPGPG